MTQDDVLFPHLTVKETLTYTARLRVPRTLTREQKEQRAIEVIQGLGLERYVSSSRGFRTNQMKVGLLITTWSVCYRCQDTMIGHIHKNMICIRFRVLISNIYVIGIQIPSRTHSVSLENLSVDIGK